jgi:asparagine synthase (glutamine-hydrolysing)
MCGISGLVNFGSGGASRSAVEAMIGCLCHRGPDNIGVNVCGPAGFGHARLSIIDLSERGNQPMTTPDDRYVLTYNGEVYNYRSLRDQLAAEGASFQSGSDSEVVLQALIHWGERALPRLHGMFAFAFWDRREQRLLLARDRFGIKPLYYRVDGSGPAARIVFGSEIKAVLAADVPREIEPQALSEFMWYGNALGQRTIYRGIHRLLPGHTLSFSAKGVETRAYWSVNDPPEISVSAKEAVEEIRARLDRAVIEHLESDVPVGVFLSGGIDSSAMTAFASRHYRGKLHTYSVGFDFLGHANELPAARRISEHFGTEHHELHIAGGNMPSVIERLVSAHDEPFGDAANIPLYLLCEQLKGQVKVVLQGDGGDEMFAGYRRYPMLAAAYGVPGAARVAHALTNLAGPVLSPSRRRFARALFEPDPARRMALLLTQESEEAPPTDLLGPELRRATASCDPFLRYREMHQRLRGFDAVQEMLRTDAAILLPDTFLEKVDKSTMAHGIEIRVPFLDAELSSYAMSLPASLKTRGGTTKWILREALRGIVPDWVLDAPKVGFGVPYETWLRTSLAGYLRETVTDESIVRAGLFDQPVLAKRIDEHVSGQRNHGFTLWKAMHLALWHNRFLNAR